MYEDESKIKENKNNFKKLFSVVGIIWLVYIYSIVTNYSALNVIVGDIRIENVKISEYSLNLNSTYMVLIISVFFMLSTIIQFIKNKKIQTLYYRVSAIGIIISLMYTNNFYYDNYMFTEFREFYNPIINPLIISILALLLPLTDIKRFKLNKL